MNQLDVCIANTLSQFIRARKYRKKSYPYYCNLKFYFRRISQYRRRPIFYWLLLLELPSFNELLKDHAPDQSIKLEKACLDFKKQLTVDCYMLWADRKRYQDLLAYEHSNPLQCMGNYHPKIGAVRFLN